MTAFPIDTNGDVAEGAMNLELYLDSKIATASQLSQIHHFVRRSKEEAWIQGRLERPFRTELYSLMESRFGESEDLKPIFRLPEPPGFSIYLEEDDVETIVRASLFEKAWALSTEELDSLTEYTLRVTVPARASAILPVLTAWPDETSRFLISI
ncbi:hypothetical protein BDW60DRAFT_202764 [Aspergillus nidulans var. acristatus]